MMLAMTSPRCTERSCPVRYRGGPDRPCPQHEDGHGDSFDDLGQRMSDFMAAPGDRGDGGGAADGLAASPLTTRHGHQ